MIKIYGDTDLEFELNFVDSDENEIDVDDLSVVSISAYTTNINSGCTYDKDDVEDDVLTLKSSDIASLSNGALKFRIYAEISDDDDTIKRTFDINTRYYVSTSSETNNSNCICG